MTLPKLRTTFTNTSGIMINSRFSGYDSRIVQNSARENIAAAVVPSSGVTSRRTTTTTTRVAISGPAGAPPLPIPIAVAPTAIAPLIPILAPPLTAPLSVDISDQITMTPSPEDAVLVYIPPVIRLAPLPAEDETDFFSPVEAESPNFIQNPNDESFSGPALTDAEKPKIIGISSVDVVNGRPSKNIIFFKALTSDTKKAVKYTLKKKNLLEASSYVNVSSLTTSQLIPATRFSDLINIESPEARITFGITDITFSANNIYVYKLYVEWIEKTAEEKQLINVPSEETLIAASSLFRTI